MEKITLPIKTKIAAWWMIIIGGVLGIFCLLITVLSLRLLVTGGCKGMCDYDGLIQFVTFIIVLPISLFFLSVGFSILKRKKWAWRFALFILLILIISLLVLLGFFYFF